MSPDRAHLVSSAWLVRDSLPDGTVGRLQERGLASRVGVNTLAGCKSWSGSGCEDDGVRHVCGGEGMCVCACVYTHGLV